MRGKRNHLGMYILVGFVLCFATLAPKMIAFAGGINEHEAGVIAAASGTFSYDGKTYRAGSAYLNSLTSYLSGDAVDLTAEEASEAISMMYANIAQGVEQGYLYEEGATAGTTEESSETTTEDDDWAPAEHDDDKKDSTETDKDDVKSQTEDEVNVWEAMSNPTEQKKQLENRPDAEDASASVELEDEQIVVTTKDNETISIEKNKPIISNNIIIGIDVFAGIIFVITCVCSVILFVTKCMTFRNRKSKKARPGHSKRRKIRHNTRAVLTVTSAIGMIAIMLLMGLYVSLFDKDAIMQNMQSSGYFRYAYSQYITAIADDMKEQVASGNFDAAEQDKIVSYEDYLYTIKNNSLKVLDGETNIPIPDTNVAPYIVNLKNSYADVFSVAGVLFIVSTVAAVILMIFMDLRRERGIKHTAAAVLCAGVVMGVATLIMVIYKPYMYLYIEPDYLYLFLMECIKRCVMVMVSITAFGVALGMILSGVYRSYCNKRNE